MGKVGSRVLSSKGKKIVIPHLLVSSIIGTLFISIMLVKPKAIHSPQCKELY